MSAHLISTFLFFHSLLFGGIAISTNQAPLSHHVKHNINNLSDGLLMGLILFGFLPHLLGHWMEEGHSLILIAGLIILPAFLASACGNALKNSTSHIAFITFSIFILHSLIEGAALGSSFSRPEFTLILFSLLLHKSVENFCFMNQISQILKTNKFIFVFLITHALAILVGFESGLQFKHQSHLMHDLEIYLDCATVMSLIFLIFFCNSTRHSKKCSHGWNWFSWGGFISSALLLSTIY